jgi:hypothetical protein
MRAKNWYTCKQAGEGDECSPKSPWVNSEQGGLPLQSVSHARPLDPRSTDPGARKGTAPERSMGGHHSLIYPPKSPDVSPLDVERVRCRGSTLVRGVQLRTSEAHKDLPPPRENTV